MNEVGARWKGTRNCHGRGNPWKVRFCTPGVSTSTSTPRSSHRRASRGAWPGVDVFDPRRGGSLTRAVVFWTRIDYVVRDAGERAGCGLPSGVPGQGTGRGSRMVPNTESSPEGQHASQDTAGRTGTCGNRRGLRRLRNRRQYPIEARCSPQVKSAGTARPPRAFHGKLWPRQGDSNMRRRRVT